MFRKIKQTKTTLTVNKSYEGETIEKKINRIVNNKEPITDGAPLIYTERKEGVQPEYDIRTDRFEVAVDAMDKVQKSHAAKREEKAKKIADAMNENKVKTEKNKDGGTEPTQGTGNAEGSAGK